MNPLKTSYKYIGLIGYITLLTLGISVEGNVSAYFLGMSLVLMLFLDNKVIPLCFIFQIFVTDNVLFTESLSYGSLATFFFLVRCLFLIKEHRGSHIYTYAVITAITIIQLGSLVIYDNQILNIARFVANLFVLSYFSKIKIDNITLMRITATISLSILIGCLLSFQKSAQFDDLGVLRFSGIWIDENFCGMYCIIGIVSSIYSIILHKQTLIFAIPSIILSVFIGTMAMSRTFIFVLLIISVYIIYSLIKNNKTKRFVKFGVFCIGIFGLYLFIEKSASFIVASRGLYSDSGDFTNYRLFFSEQSLKAFMDHPLTWFIGCGIGNSLHFKEINGLDAVASHNTYVDVLVELGIFLFIYIIYKILSFIKIMIRNISNIGFDVILCCVILLYMGTLTMGQYSILYLTLGLAFRYINLQSR